LNCVYAFETAHDGGIGHHRVLYALKERFVCQMGVVLTKHFIRQLYHFHSGQAQAFSFESVNYLSDKPALYSAGLQNDQRLFHHPLDFFKVNNVR
jgi:hypothetical protein